MLEDSERTARALLDRRLWALSDTSRATFNAMEFGFLYDLDRQLLSIGYRGSDGTLDTNYYDLLASEARLTSFIAIAKGDIPARHWFRLGRTLTPIDGGSGLISWSGSMFEYLMPSLVMHARRRAVCSRRRTGWSCAAKSTMARNWAFRGECQELQYNMRDIEKTYQYSAFGVL